MNGCSCAAAPRWRPAALCTRPRCCCAAASPWEGTSAQTCACTLLPSSRLNSQRFVDAASTQTDLSAFQTGDASWTMLCRSYSLVAMLDTEGARTNPRLGGSDNERIQQGGCRLGGLRIWTPARNTIGIDQFGICCTHLHLLQSSSPIGLASSSLPCKCTSCQI